MASMREFLWLVEALFSIMVKPTIHWSPIRDVHIKHMELALSNRNRFFFRL